MKIIRTWITKSGSAYDEEIAEFDTLERAAVDACQFIANAGSAEKVVSSDPFIIKTVEGYYVSLTSDAVSEVVSMTREKYGEVEAVPFSVAVSNDE